MMTSAARTHRWRKKEVAGAPRDTHDSVPMELGDPPISFPAAQALQRIMNEQPELPASGSHGEHATDLDLRIPLVLPDQNWRARAVGHDIYVINNPRVVFCRHCQAVVSDPIAHFKAIHNLAIPEQYFSLCDLDINFEFKRDSVVDAFPDMQIYEGCRCSTCGWCWVYKKNAKACNCSIGPTNFEFGVKMQQLHGRGSFRSCVAVIVPEELPVIDTKTPIFILSWLPSPKPFFLRGRRLLQVNFS